MALVIGFIMVYRKGFDDDIYVFRILLCVYHKWHFSFVHKQRIDLMVVSKRKY